MVRVGSEHQLDNFLKFWAVSRGQGFVIGRSYFLEENLHVLSFKGWDQGCHFIEHAAYGPDIAFEVIGHVPPNLWTRIIGCASLCAHKTLLTVDDFRHIKIG